MIIYTGYDEDGNEVCEYESAALCRQTPKVVGVWAEDRDAVGMAAQPRKVWAKEQVFPNGRY